MNRQGLLFIISAPSGAGKTSICSEIIAAIPDLRQSISYTTRAIRSGEQDGIDYHFVSQVEFDKMVENGAFVEWAEVHDNCYGTARETIDTARSAGINVLLDIDYQGATQLRKTDLDGVFIFILPPSMAELRRRLTDRNTDSEEVIARRMQNAVVEISQAAHFDYLVINDDLERAVADVRAIMYAESLRTPRVLPNLPEEFGLK